jgi:hypothetical protein
MIFMVYGRQKDVRKLRIKLKARREERMKKTSQIRTTMS